jgi:dTDP-4-dehydrorhamnose 3,5-epimerase
MIFHAQPVRGAYVLESIEYADERGTFTRLWCAERLREMRLTAVVSQASVSRNPRAGTLRGLHYQVEPHEEAKVVRCLRGSIFDVVLDLRPGEGFGRWMGVVLGPDDQRSVYVPPGCAHGFQVLEDDTDVLYMISSPYTPEAARGVRWDDPAFGIEWPLAPTVLSERDRSWPDYVA